MRILPLTKRSWKILYNSYNNSSSNSNNNQPQQQQQHSAAAAAAAAYSLKRLSSRDVADNQQVTVRQPLTRKFTKNNGFM